MTSLLTEQLVQWRRELHQHPELSHQEFATTERITRWLKQGDIRLLPLPLKTGVVAEIGQGEPLIAFRADIDALPIDEGGERPLAIPAVRRHARLRARHSYLGDARRGTSA